MNKIIIFDGDDTLWQTQEHYNRAKTDFIHLLNLHGINDSTITQLLDTIDQQRVVLFKFDKSRFMESMLITYAILCGKYGIPWHVNIEHKIRKIADTISSDYPQLYEDTLDTLKDLKNNFNLVLLTDGNIYMQTNRIASIDGFKSLFKQVFCINYKTTRVYEAILHIFDVKAEDTWVVGNDVKIDLAPALELNINCILISRDNSKSTENNNIYVVHSLTEAAKLIKDKGGVKSENCI